MTVNVPESARDHSAVHLSQFLSIQRRSTADEINHHIGLIRLIFISIKIRFELTFEQNTEDTECSPEFVAHLRRVIYRDDNPASDGGKLQ